MSGGPSIVRQTREIVGAFDLTLRIVEIPRQGLETWSALTRRDAQIRIIVLTDRGVLLSRQHHHELDVLRISVTPSEDIPTKVRSAVTSLGARRVKLRDLGKSAPAATLDGNIHFVLAQTIHAGLSESYGEILEPSALFDALQSDRIRDDRTARRLYDLLDVTTTDTSYLLTSSRPSLRCRDTEAWLNVSGHEQVQMVGLFCMIRDSYGRITRVARPDGVRVLAFDVNNTKLILTREKRSEIGGYDWRLPGGKVLDGKPSSVAREEFLAETGYEANDLTCLHTSADDRDVDYRLHYYIGRAGTYTGQRLHGAEEIDTHFKSPGEVLAHLRSKSIDGIQEDRSGRVLYELLPLSRPTDFDIN